MSKFVGAPTRAFLGALLTCGKFWLRTCLRTWMPSSTRPSRCSSTPECQ